EAETREVKRIIDGHGLVVCSIASPFGKCELDNPAEMAEHMEFLRRAADIGHALGCNLIRGFAFWGHEYVGPRPWDKMLKAYEPVPRILEEMDAVLGLENEAACYVGTAAHAREFIDRLGCPRVKIV